MTYPIYDWLQPHIQELTALRRHFHEHPELSKQEFQTMAYIESRLSDMQIPYHRVDQGGIIAWIDGARPGKTVLLRADIDALPIDEGENNLSCPRLCRSQQPGVMHACGHDGHMAMLLIAAAILKEQCRSWDGKVILMFEQGEEESGPLPYLLEYLEKESSFAIDTCYATHVRWDLPAGSIAVCRPAPMAGGFGFDIRLTGQSGHGSRPDLARNPIDCFHALYGDMQALRMRAAAPQECLTLSVGSIHGGTAGNIIPQELTFAGTCRFFSYDHAGKRVYEEFLRLLESRCRDYGCTYEIIRMPKPLYEVQNNPVCADLAEQAVRTYIGADALASCTPWMASESFAVTARLYPGVLTFTGIQNLKKGCGANHHTPEFDIDEDGLPYGVMACLGYTLDFLSRQPDIPFARPDEPFEDVICRNL